MKKKLFLLFLLVPLIGGAQQFQYLESAEVPQRPSTKACRECVPLDQQQMERVCMPYLNATNIAANALAEWKVAISGCEKQSKGLTDDCWTAVDVAEKKLVEAQSRKQWLHGVISHLVQTFSNVPLQTDRLRKSMESVQRGDFHDADLHLPYKTMMATGNALISQKSQGAKLPEVAQQLVGLSNEFLFKAFLKATGSDGTVALDSVKLCMQASLKHDANDFNLASFGLLLADLGEYPAALIYMEDALKSKSSNENEIRISWNLGLIHDKMHNAQLADKLLGQAIFMRENMAVSKPKAYQPALSAYCLHAVQRQLDAGRNDEATELAIRAVDVLGKLVSKNHAYAIDLGESQTGRGKVAIAQSDWSVAEEALLQSLETLKSKKIDANAAAPLIANVHCLLGDAQAKQGSHLAAQINYSFGIEEYKRLPAGDRSLFESAIASASASRLASLEARGNDEDIEESHLDVIQIYDHLRAIDPIGFEATWTMAVMDHANFFQDNHENKEADAEYARAWPTYQRLSRKDPARLDPEWLTAALNYSNNCMILQKRDKVEGIMLFCLELGAALVKLDPKRHEFNLAKAQTQLGIYYGTVYEFAKGIAVMELSYASFKRMAVENPGSYQPEVAWAAVSLGTCKLYSQANEEAEVLFEDALRIHEKLAAEKPKQYEPSYANTIANLAELYTELGKQKEAEAYYKKDIEICLRLAKRNPEVYDIELAQARNRYGSHLYTFGQFDEAREQFYQSQLGCQRVILNGQPHQFVWFKYPFKNLDRVADTLATRKEWTTVVSIQEDRLAAITAIQDVIDDPDSLLISTLGSISWHYLFTKQYAEGQAAAQKALKLAPNENWIRTNLGHAYLFQGDSENAMKTYRMYIERSADPNAAKKTLGEDWDTFELEQVLSPENLAAIRRARVSL